MRFLQVFDPPLCCPSGVCGSDVDPTLVNLAADLKWLEGHGVTIERFNLSQSPLAFVRNERVIAALREEGPSALPIFIVDDAVVARGKYLERQALAALCGLDATVAAG